MLVRPLMACIVDNDQCMWMLSVWMVLITGGLDYLVVVQLL